MFAIFRPRKIRSLEGERQNGVYEILGKIFGEGGNGTKPLTSSPGRKGTWSGIGCLDTLMYFPFIA
jgi:hypothetical protein